MMAMWSLVRPSGEAPEARAEQAFTNSDDGTKLFLYGGQTSSTAYNDLWQFDIASSTWTRLPSPSPAPGRRWGATLSYHQNTLYLFGGEEVREDSYSHLWAYDLS
jgi:N-acetylneuraminic acid mutarotase